MVGRRQGACTGHRGGNSLACTGRLRLFAGYCDGALFDGAMISTDSKRSFAFMKIAKSLSAISLSFMFVGCMVGPKYQRPAVQTPAAYRDLSENPQLQSQTASYADLPWWQVFQDPKLQELICLALKQNYDLQLASERIVAARAELAITRSNLFPQIGGNGT